MSKQYLIKLWKKIITTDDTAILIEELNILDFNKIIFILKKQNSKFNIWFKKYEFNY